MVTQNYPHPDFEYGPIDPITGHARWLSLRGGWELVSTINGKCPVCGKSSQNDSDGIKHNSGFSERLASKASAGCAPLERPKTDERSERLAAKGRAGTLPEAGKQNAALERSNKVNLRTSRPPQHALNSPAVGGRKGPGPALPVAHRNCGGL